MVKAHRQRIACTESNHRVRSGGLLEPLEARRLLSTGPYAFFGGRVVVEAEDFDTNMPQGGHSWQTVSGGVGGAMQALPDTGANIDSNIEAGASRLDYQIDFPSAGEHIIWIRGRAVAGAVDVSDSLHVGLNGTVQSGSDRLTGFGADWTWSADTMDVPGTHIEARFAVPAPGVHTVNLYMREDGLTIDRFFISQDSEIRPIENTAGPRQSERKPEGSTENPASVAGSLANPNPLAGPLDLAFDGHQVQEAQSIVPAAGGGFYVFGRSQDNYGSGGHQYYATRHLPSGALDTSFGSSGRIALSATSPLVRGRKFAHPSGGVLAWTEEHGGPNLLHRFTANLAADTSYSGDGIVPAGDTFDIAPNGVVVTLRLGTEANAFWTRYDAAGNVVTSVERPAPWSDAPMPPSGEIPYSGIIDSQFEVIEAMSDGSVFVTLDHPYYNGIRKYNTDFTPQNAYASDSTVDLTMWDVDSQQDLLEAAPDGRLALSERDADGENYLSLVDPAGNVTASDQNYYLGLYDPYSVAFGQSVRFHGDGDVSIAYAIWGSPTWVDRLRNGFGVDRFNSDGTRESSFASFDVIPPTFGDETLNGQATALLADGTFVAAGNASGDALVWRIDTGGGQPLNESNGRVDVQAEGSTGQAGGTGNAANHTWNQISDGGAGGGSALISAPNTNLNLGDGTNGPRRDYAINFTNTGTYYVWVRMAGANGNDDSLHVGLNGVLASNNGGISLSSAERNGAWFWKDRKGGDVRVTVNVTTPGVHTLNLWMREDGTKVDQFILSNNPNFNPNSGGGGGFNESGGRVDFQAEASTGSAPGSGSAASHTWNQISDGGAGGGAALVANPNSNVNVGDGTNGPRRDYSINFTNTGTYYVWVRMAGASGSDDSLHVGMNGAATTLGSQGIALASNERNGAWFWKSREFDGSRVTVSVPSPGVRTFNLWMREDGVKADQFILTRDANFDPNAPAGQTLHIEAEFPTAQQPGSGSAAGHSWGSFASGTASGGTAMVANPNTNLNVGDSTSGPRLDYSVNLTSTGTYYIWTRMSGTSGSDDSLHVGLDGTPATFGSQGIALAADQRNGSWFWKDRSWSGARVAVNVSSAGTHTLNVWMREDGVRIDKLIITTDAGFVPS